MKLMEQQQLLRSFEYSILQTSVSFPLVSVRIDFEHGNFLLEGSWKFMVASNKNVRQSRAARKRERVRVKSILYPSLSVDLADEKNENLCFTLDGIIQDDVILTTCTGMLTLEQIRYTDGSPTGEWILSFYLYNVIDQGCEINFRLPMLPEQQYNGLN